jgi:pimeloyl-ACP methyl ester carboxylesterase
MAVPILLVPGLGCSARLYEAQISALWRFGPVTVANHREGDSVAEIARHILETAPPRFALAGLSLGGYVAFEIVRQAPRRVLKLALLDTSARPDTPEQTELRKQRVALAEAGRYADIARMQFPLSVHESRHEDAALFALYRAMQAETGAEAYVRWQRAIMLRADMRPFLPEISCPTLALVGDADKITPLPLAEEMAAGIRGAELVVVSACGHLSAAERPEEVNAALVGWMERS